MKNKNIIRITLVTALILTVPLVAMQFTNEVNWGVFDFIVAGILIFSTGLAYELIVRKGGSTAYRVAAGITIGTTFLLIWANLAVGLIGSGPNPANLMYISVPVVGIIGAFVGNFQPLGMTRALFAMALTQILVPVLAVIIEQFRPVYDQILPDTRELLGVTAFFVVPWVVSALLFRRAGTNPQANAV